MRIITCALALRVSMRFILSVLSLAALSGCAATNTSFVGPSGAQTNSAKCNVSPQGCYQEASKICHGPYQVLDSESHAGGLAADILPGPVTWYAMTYSCGPSDGQLPSFAFKGPVFTPPAPPVTTNCQKYGNSVNCQTY